MTRILVTIGPTSNNEKSIRSFANQTKLFRLNGSHNTLEWHKETVAKIRKYVPDAFILLDVPGAKPRTNNLQPIDIKRGDTVTFGYIGERHNILSVALTKPLPQFDGKAPSTFSLNDGQFLFDTTEMTETYIVGRSRGAFKLMPKKGVNIPNSVYCENLQLQICTDFIQSVIDLDINAFGLSFIQNGHIIDELREFTGEKVLISKIENSEGLKNSSNIILRSDAVMIDRGDLAAEIGFEFLYNAVEEITYKTKVGGKPLIMATENLDSMSERDTPSKSEVMSLAHSVSIGADCVMLSEETALAENGPYIVTWLHNFLQTAAINIRSITVSKEQEKYETIWKILAEYTRVPVVLMSKSGYSLFNFMSIRTNQNVTIVTDNVRVHEVVKLFSSEVCVIKCDLKDSVPVEKIWEVVKSHASVLFKESDQIAAVYVSKYVTGARANCITFFNKADF